LARSFCFVTYELAPVNRGGAGVVVAALAEYLAGLGNEVHILADMPLDEVERYRERARSLGLSGLAVHAISEVVHLPNPGTTLYRWKSLQFRAALELLSARARLDVVEFCEYAGMAFDTLVRRPAGLRDAAVGTRIHGSLAAIDRAEGVFPTSDRLAMHSQERWALRLSDFVLTPSRGTGEEYALAHGLKAERVAFCPPPMERILSGIGRAEERDETSKRVLFLGKLQLVKGCDLFVEAGVILADQHPSLSLSLVGPDIPTESGQSTRAMLEELIPPERKDRFYFLPSVLRADLGSLVSRFLCAVVPSRSESYCLVAHELARLGTPLVLNDITAFRGEFEDGRNCLKFDGTVEGLVTAIERLIDSPDLARELSEEGLTRRYPDPASTYADLRPHPPTGLEDLARWELDALSARAFETLDAAVTDSERSRRSLPARLIGKARRTAASLRSLATRGGV